MHRWDETPVKFRDPPQGYIEVPRIFVKNLIDTPYIQRIKGVAQTGIRPLYPTATHDRFCHSLGVYRYSVLAYKNLRTDIRKNACYKHKLPPKDIEPWLSLSGVLLSIAAILHDVGHPVGSHAFEFLYDDAYMPLEGEVDTRDKKGIECKEQPPCLTERLRDLLDIPPNQKVSGSEHERMGAYMILTSKPLRDAIEVTINAYLEQEELDGRGIQDCNYHFFDAGSTREELIGECIRYICRMITGQEYIVEYAQEFDLAKYIRSVKNCIIAVLNGCIDTDSIDYTMRNAYYGGYAAHQVDYDRLCSAFSVYEKNFQLYPCFKKSSISVIEGFVSARNAEPKWLYSHHKVVYHDVLIKQIFYYIAKYLCYNDLKGVDEAVLKRLDLTKMYQPYLSYMIAPIATYTGCVYNFSGSNDATLESLYRDILIRLSKENPPDKICVFTENDREKLLNLLNEYVSRKFKSSLWKSYTDYNVLVNKTSVRLGIPRGTVRRYMLDMITQLPRIYDYGASAKDSFKEQIIYQCDTGVNSNTIFSKGELASYNWVCKVFKGKFKKSFGQLQFLVDGGDSETEMIMSLGELSPELTGQHSLEFPYVYVELKGFADADDEIKKLRNMFQLEFNEYCKERMIRENPLILQRNSTMNKHQTIRDVMHGDIVLPDKYLAVVRTPEFQRLLRIKQLALTSTVYPSANHSRFEHSIGTYHIMSLVVEHFNRLFSEMGITYIDSEGADVAMLAALLHDIGHGPFSHAFESICKVDHENWTERIIRESGNLRCTIENHFGADFPERVIRCIKNSKQQNDTNIGIPDFETIYAEIVSGALDVDRMDFIPRDAYYTGSKFGTIDIPKLIAAMSLTSINGKYCICFDASNMSYLQQFILARSEMYRNVYFDANKVELETLVKKVLKYAVSIRDKLAPEDKELLEKIDSGNMNVEEYLALDDFVIYHKFMTWRKNDDKLLSELCRALVDGKTEGEKYEYLGDLTCSANEFFKELTEQLAQINVSGYIPEDNYAFIYDKKDTQVYPIDEGMQKRIRILTGIGETEDFSKISGHITNNNIILKQLIYYNKRIFRLELERLICNAASKKASIGGISSVDTVANDIERFIQSKKPRSNIEIEYKFNCSAEHLERIREHAGQGGDFIYERIKSRKQMDVYFDTPGRLLSSTKRTLRIRKSESDHWSLTIKTAVKGENYGGGSPLGRNEYETVLSNSDDCPPLELMKKHKSRITQILELTEEEFSSLEVVVTIHNDRGIASITKRNAPAFKCEICLDTMHFDKGGQKSENKHQIEIELKSEDYLARVVLDSFKNEIVEICNKAGGIHIVPESKSKYDLAIEWLAAK